MIRSQGRLDYITGMRGVAVLAVLLLHTYIWTGVEVPQRVDLLAHGVDLFFVISGFCMTWPLLVDGRVGRLQPWPFLRRRWRRIAPPYLVAVCAAVLVSALMWRLGGPSWWGQPMQSTFGSEAPNLVGNLATHATFLHGFFPHYDRAIDGAFWSLSTEWQFYLLLPLLIPVARRLGILAAGALTAAVSAGGALYVHANFDTFDTSIAHDVIFIRLVQFGVGMVAAVWVSRGTLARAPWAVLAVLALVLAIAGPHVGPDMAWVFLWAAATGAAVMAAAHSRPVHAAVTSPALLWLGRVSYSLYLIHGTAFMLLAVVLTNLDLPTSARAALMVVVGVPLSLGAGWLLHRSVEAWAVSWSHQRRAGRVLTPA